MFKHTDKSLAYFGVKSCAGCLDIRGDRPSAANVLTLHTAKTGVQTLYHEYTLSTKFLVNHFCSESKREHCCGGSSLCSCTSMRCFRKRSGSKVGAGGFRLPEAQARQMPIFVLCGSYFRILRARISLSGRFAMLEVRLTEIVGTDRTSLQRFAALNAGAATAQSIFLKWDIQNADDSAVLAAIEIPCHKAG